MSPVIHIGYPKAASTWLQKSLFPLVENFSYVNEHDVAQKILKPGVFKFSKTGCQDYFSANYKKPLLISDERFLGSFNLGWNNGTYTKELSIRLRSIFPEATILLIIRSQVDVIASAYVQYIKDGGTISINKFLHTPPNFTFQNILKFSFEQLEYDKVIHHYNTLFPGRIKVFFFEELQENPSGFIRKIKDEFGFKVNEQNIDIYPTNQRYTQLILWLSRITNIFTRNGSMNKYYLVHLPGYHSLSKRIWKTLSLSGLCGQSANTYKILGTYNLEIIKNYYTESNGNLGKYVPLELLKKYNYPI